MRQIGLSLLVSIQIILLSSPVSLAQEGVSPSLDKGLFGPFTRSLNVMPHGYRVIDDPTGLAPSGKVERFEVRPGDCHFNGGWSDCEKDRERSELSERGERSQAGSSSWYGCSFYVPPDWSDISPTKTVLGQFHQDKSHPVWMFQNYKGGLYLDDQSSGRSLRRILLVRAEDFRGRWHRIEVEAKWSKDERGRLNVWVNGDLVFQHSGPTMSAETVYFRYGVYRSFISRYLNASGEDEAPAQAALFANVKKAKSREGLR